MINCRSVSAHSFTLPTAHPLRDHHHAPPLGRGRPNGFGGGGARPSEEDRRPAEEQPVQRVGAERPRSGDAVQHGPELGG